MMMTFYHKLHCDLRGVFTVNTLQIGSGWPFGFVDLSVQCDTPKCQLIVMPRSFSIDHLPTFPSDISAMESYNQTADASLQNEFASVREYRFGDSLKHIHWGASARHQELIVREYESHDRPHFLLVLDAQTGCDQGEAPHSSFEYAVTVAAAMIEYAVEKQLSLYLIAATLIHSPTPREPRWSALPTAWHCYPCCLADPCPTSY